MGFVDRPKDANDPEQAREGYVMTDSDLIFNREGALQTVALTPLLLPVGSHVNSDFGGSGHLNPGAKPYLLYSDTDIDFAWQRRGSRPARGSSTPHCRSYRKPGTTCCCSEPCRFARCTLGILSEAMTRACAGHLVDLFRKHTLRRSHRKKFA
jgi:hypothetical protein